MSVGESLDLAVRPTSIPRPRSANDYGVDIIAHVDFRDQRYGRIVLVGQATCGKTDTWKEKARQVHQGWMRLLGMHVSPLKFLAVPHHIGDVFHDCVVSATGRFLFDRVRLVLLYGNDELQDDEWVGVVSKLRGVQCNGRLVTEEETVGGAVLAAGERC